MEIEKQQIISLKTACTLTLLLQMATKEKAFRNNTLIDLPVRGFERGCSQSAN